MNSRSEQLRSELVAPTIGPERIWDALAHNPDVAFVLLRVLPDGNFLVEQVNAAFQMFVTVPWQRLPGQLLSDCLIPESVTYAHINLRRCTETGRPLCYERAMELAGRRRAWTTNLVPIRNAEGIVSHVVGFGRPIPLELYQGGADERNAALVASLGVAAPGLIYLFDLERRRNRLVSGQHGNPLGYRPHEVEEMTDPTGQLLHPDDRDRMDAHYRSMAKLADGEVASIDFRLRHSDGEYRHFAGRHMVFSRHGDGSVALMFGMADDVTDRDRMLMEVDGLSERLLSLQVEERQRIAQDLHDSTGQHIVAAELALARIQLENAAHGDDDPRARTLRRGLRDVMSSLKEAEREIRVLTYLLHPPAFRDRGFSAALRTFATGFARRAGIEIQIELDEDADRLPDDVLIPLLRFSQESLTNVHRHAKASRVSIGLALTDRAAVLTIADNGRGFGQTQLALAEHTGVGLAGARDRLERRGGSLELRDDGGAVVVATLPIGDNPSASIAPAVPTWLRQRSEPWALPVK